MKTSYTVPPTENPLLGQGTSDNGPQRRKPTGKLHKGPTYWKSHGDPPTGDRLKGNPQGTPQEDPWGTPPMEPQGDPADPQRGPPKGTPTKGATTKGTPTKGALPEGTPRGDLRPEGKLPPRGPPRRDSARGIPTRGPPMGPELRTPHRATTTKDTLHGFLHILPDSGTPYRGTSTGDSVYRDNLQGSRTRDPMQGPQYKAPRTGNPRHDPLQVTKCKGPLTPGTLNVDILHVTPQRTIYRDSGVRHWNLTAEAYRGPPQWTHIGDITRGPTPGQPLKLTLSRWRTE
jgi:hypothetical protein